MSDERSNPWALWGSVICLSLCAVVFITSTSPALVENQELREVGRSFEDEVHNYSKLLRDFRSRGLTADASELAEQDLQGLLVAIDALGHTPAELLALFPEEPETPR